MKNRTEAETKKISKLEDDIENNFFNILKKDLSIIVFPSGKKAAFLGDARTMVYIDNHYFADFKLKSLIKNLIKIAERDIACPELTKNQVNKIIKHKIEDLVRLEEDFQEIIKFVKSEQKRFKTLKI